MTREDIIRMAREAGFPDYAMGLASEDAWQKTELFAALVAAAEREACAEVCEKQMKSYMSKQYTVDPLGGFRERFAAEQCAAAIRARGSK
jgi:hypothetical protein